MPKAIKIIFLFALILSSCFLTYKSCYFIAEKYFFDKLFYKKSAKHGYYVPNSNPKFFAERNKDMNLVNSNNQNVLGTKDKYYQIAVIGDSYVLGMGIRNNQRFAKILEEKLNHIGPTKITILSETSTSPINYLEWYNKMKANTTINLYIFSLVNNDAYIRPNPNQTPIDTNDVIKNCQKKFPLITPILDTSLLFFYQGINRDNNKNANEIASQEFEASWSNPINLCALDSSIQLLPTNKAIYFITDNYFNNNDKYKIYQDYLVKNNKYIISSIKGKDIKKYAKYWNTNPYQNFQVSKTEQHPNALANQMYADILFNEITTNPKWGFIK